MAAGVDWIHFDVMDGQFVPPITFGADLVASLRDLGDTPFEAHLMTRTPEQHFEAFVKAGCQRVIFHAEATDHAHRLAQQLREHGVGVGVAVNPGTPSSVMENLVDLIDLALLMTVNPGWGGQRFIDSMLTKIADVRRMGPLLDIEVDGGINASTIQSARNAGANVFVTGSYLMAGNDIAGTVSELRAACS